eukprot:2014-Heterococcus_DN1.PRE.2
MAVCECCTALSHSAAASVALTAAAAEALAAATAAATDDIVGAISCAYLLEKHSERGKTKI